MTRLRWLFLALGLMGGLLLLFSQMGRRYISTDLFAPDDQRPDAYLSDYRIRFYHPSGELYLDLGGPSLTHHSETRINRAKSPQIAYYTPEGQHVELNADNAIYPFSGHVFTLNGNVNVIQSGVDPLIPELLITTRNLVYYPYTRHVVTQSLVTLLTPAAQLTTVGIEGNLNERRFVLKNHVQGIFRYE